MAALTAHPGKLETLLSGELSSALGTGQEYALLIGTKGIPIIGWQLSYSGGNPAAITVILESSQDGTNWYTIDTSTNVNGEVRALSGTYRFIRANNSAVTTGTGIALTVYFTYATQTTASYINSYTLASATKQTKTTAGTTEEDLVVTNIPADWLGNLYSGVEVIAIFKMAANTHSRTCKIYVGTNALASLANAVSGDVVVLQIKAFVSATNEICLVGTQSIKTGTSTGNFYTGGGIATTLSAPVPVKISAITPSAAGEAILVAYRITLLR